MKPLAEAPAPKRGHYDRALTRNERQAAQQERVIVAILAIAAAGRALSVASVVEHAGIGRNTFYEYFDDVEHALSAINSRARRELSTRVEIALRSARTPLERVRALARAWAECVSANPGLSSIAFRTAGSDAAKLSVLGRYIATVLDNETDARSALPGVGDRLRTTAVAAVFEAVTRTHMVESPAADDLAPTLADFALRLLR